MTDEHRAHLCELSSSVASTSGRRSPPALWPSMFSAAFVQVGLAVMNSVS